MKKKAARIVFSLLRDLRSSHWNFLSYDNIVCAVFATVGMLEVYKLPFLVMLKIIDCLNILLLPLCAANTLDGD